MPTTEAVGEKRGGFGFLKRAFQEVKRVGAAIDPDAVADLEKAWSVSAVKLVSFWFGFLLCISTYTL